MIPFLDLQMADQKKPWIRMESRPKSYVWGWHHEDQVKVLEAVDIHGVIDHVTEEEAIGPPLGWSWIRGDRYIL